MIRRSGPQRKVRGFLAKVTYWGVLGVGGGVCQMLGENSSIRLIGANQRIKPIKSKLSLQEQIQCQRMLD